MKKLRVLLLNTQMEAAGAQKAMLVLAKGLQDLGHEVTVVTMYDKANIVEHFSHQYGVKIIDLQMKRKGHDSSLAKASHTIVGLWRLYRLMLTGKFDVVQTFTHYSNIVGPILAWLAHVQLRVSSQRNSLKGASAWLLWLDRIIANSPLVSAMVTVSEGTRQFSIEKQGIRPERLITIHNGIDVESYIRDATEDDSQLLQELGLSPGIHLVITVARLHPQKGHYYLLHAIPEILNGFPATKFLFVGEGELRSKLETLAYDLGVQDAVLFLGVRQDIPDLLSLCDIFVLPSLWEGLPNSVLEAMAAGLPVVATNVDGCPELITEGETGYLVPPQDSDAIRRAVTTLLNDSKLRYSMGIAARNRAVQKFSQAETISSFLELYKQFLPIQK